MARGKLVQRFIGLEFVYAEHRSACAAPIPLSSFAAHFPSQILTSWQQLSYCFDGFGQKLAYALDEYAVISMGNIDGD